jgi:hypothetical protein
MVVSTSAIAMDPDSSNLNVRIRIKTLWSTRILVIYSIYFQTIAFRVLRYCVFYILLVECYFMSGLVAKMYVINLRVFYRCKE